MSSTAFDAPLTLAPEPSRALRIALLVAHGLAGASLPILPGPWIAGGAAALAGSLALEWRRAHSRYRLRWRADGRWEQPDGEPAQLHASTFVGPWFVVLALQSGGRIRRWFIVRDALAPVTWRRLRARLRVAGAALTDAGRATGTNR